jgi:hypothetical protein
VLRAHSQRQLLPLQLLLPSDSGPRHFFERGEKDTDMHYSSFLSVILSHLLIYMRDKTTEHLSMAHAFIVRGIYRLDVEET